MRFARWGWMLLLVTFFGAAAAWPQQEQTPPPSSQQHEDPLVTAAHRTQEEKKDLPKAKKVWDNDTIPSVPGTINVVGQAPSPATDSAAPDKPAAAPADKASIQTNLSQAKAQLDSLKTDLDILQRKYALDQQMYLSKPEYSSDKTATAALQDEKDQMDAKQQAVADAEKQVADLQAKLDTANSSDAK